MIHGIILAAGRSSRMGRPKALLPSGVPGEVFLDRVVASLRAGGVHEIVLVTGADADPIGAHVARRALPVRLVHNVNHEKGQLSSLHAGLVEVARSRAAAAMVALVDTPFFDPVTVRALSDAHDAHHSLIIRPVNQGRHGHPVVFDRTLFVELLAADPAGGAKVVVHAHRDEILEVNVSDEGAFTDIDTPEEYQRISKL